MTGARRRARRLLARAVVQLQAARTAENDRERVRCLATAAAHLRSAGHTVMAERVRQLAREVRRRHEPRRQDPGTLALLQAFSRPRSEP